MISKEDILNAMNHEDYKAMGYQEMTTLFRITKKNKLEFKKLLAELFDDGKIFRNKRGKYILPDPKMYIEGTLQGHAKGFGFVIPENNLAHPDIFISPSDLMGALDGDRVLVKLINKSVNSKSAEGEIIRILDRGRSKMVGTFEENRNFGFVRPDNKKIYRDIYIPKDKMKGAQNGDKVVVSITLWPDSSRNPEGKIVEILGGQGEVGVDILSIVREHNLPEEFPPEVIATLDKIPERIHEKERLNRRDLTQEKTVTIDGKDAKDIDDAISIKKLPNGNFKLGVHIADVSYYVNEKTPLDKEAYDRGNSVYLADRVIPMLPKELSNGICSLNAGVDRLSFSCEMEIDHLGKVVNHELFKSVINVNEKMTYDDVTEILINSNEELTIRYSQFVEEFKLMAELAEILREKRRMSRGAIDFDFPEAKIILNEKGKAIDIVKVERNISNRIIEEFMLVCNETVAEHMFWTELPFIYRNHEEPNEDKLHALNEFIGNFGYRLRYKDTIHPSLVQKLLGEISGKEEEGLLSRLILRSMQQARYAEENLGHFGLSAKYYTHFTAPIRRYSDLMIHRIMSYMLNNTLSDKKIGKFQKSLPEIAKQCSKRERTAELAERDVDDLKKCEYMSSKIDQVFQGIISSVTSFGFFVELENTVEGLVRVQNIEDDYYIYDEKNHKYIGEHTKRMFKLGDTVEVMVYKVDMSTRQIDFLLVDKNE